MSKRGLTVLVSAAFFFGIPCCTLAYVFDSGGEHTIDFAIEESVDIRNSPSGEATTVNLVSGGSVSGDLRVYNSSTISSKSSLSTLFVF